ncbi:hypothetical protein Fcan01_26133 [Folsomia candida]|uniref:NodB homology domain-containing protein n=1 Tax=Folsomia candida TaxID=158441 RepID=A0A226D4E0_FOLCA|nr:hypothetical protein Fcan01_26133 [Folsomia candida]
MGQLIILMTLCAITFRVSHQFSQVDPKFVPALPCNYSACYLPDCRCSSDLPPGGLYGPNLPQMVLFTFDGAITPTNHPFFYQVFNNRRNPNGAPMSVTFFVTHEFTNYSLVHDLWASGHDIAAHSITYDPNMAYWRTLSESGWRSEIVDQQEQIARFGSLPSSHVPKSIIKIQNHLLTTHGYFLSFVWLMPHWTGRRPKAGFNQHLDTAI